MKKLLFILFAVVAFGCESGSHSGERAERQEVEERAPINESEENSIHSDSTTSGGMNRQNQYDTLQ